MKVSHAVLEQLSRSFAEVGKSTHPRLVYFVARNTQAIQPVLRVILSVKAPVPGFAEYEAKHKALCTECAVQDSQGRPVTREVQTPSGLGMQYEIKHQKVFDADLVKLREEYAEVLQACMAQQVQLSKLSETAVDVDLVQIKWSDCPKGVVDGNTAALWAHAGILVWDNAEIAVLKEV